MPIPIKGDHKEIQNLDISYLNETFTTSVDNMKAMTEQLHENVLDDPNAEEIKKVKGEFFSTSNVLDNR